MLNLIFIISMLCFTTSAKEYKAVDSLSLPEYMGTWYEVYQNDFDKLFQKNSHCSRATYQIIDNNKVSVLNEALNDKNQYDHIEGYAFYKDNDCCGYLTVHLNGLNDAPYWVLELGPIYNNHYDYAIVSDNVGHSLFVLARDVDRFFKSYNEDVLASLQEFGFNKKYNYPIEMNQTDCTI